MAKLIIKFNDVVIDQIVLKQGDMNIGRRPGSDIVLDNLSVSGNHASIFTIGEDSFIQDLNSTNGTFINNKRISKHHLENGDVVMIGNHSLTYVNENAAKSTPDLAKTVIISPQKQDDGIAQVAKARNPEPTRPQEATKQGSLFILSGANNGKRIDITMPTTNLGRAGKRAGVITRNGNRYLILPGDEGQSPKLNGARVGASGEELKNGDMIEIADARMQFYLK
jgi:pSer/pThr/pTyr-binding forkhead associated (FHA) protein